MEHVSASNYADLYQNLISKTESLCVIGLGYVGMPIAVAFAEHLNVIGYDINKDKIALYRAGLDPTREIGEEALKRTSVRFTSDEADIQNAKFHIIAVPTPINHDKTPDLSPVIRASQVLGKNLTKGSVVVYESTVYPGVTEDICVPILEEESGLKCGADFKVGYSPERINPGDMQHRLENIVKIVSGMDPETLDVIKKVYDLVVKVGAFPVSSIKIAEAVKVAENSQRDINIAFMNELAMVLDKMGIDTAEVVDGMDSKWNALGFRPGLVGGHCIGVDPYYFIYEAEQMGYHSQIILAGHRINDSMGAFVADAAIKQMVLAGKTVKNARVFIFGITFKENCPDVRNSRIIDIVNRLREYGIEANVVDPLANAAEVAHAYNTNLLDLSAVHDADCLIIAVAHDAFKALPLAQYSALFNDSGKVLIDVKSILDKAAFLAAGYRYWRL